MTDSKLILSEVKTLTKLLEQPSTWSTRRQIRKSVRTIKKLVRSEAKNYANKTYNQTIKFYKGFLDDNLEEIVINF